MMYKRLPVTNKSRFNMRFAIVKTANEKKNFSLSAKIQC